MDIIAEMKFYGIHEAIKGDEKDKDFLVTIAMAALQTVQHDQFPEAKKNTLESEYYRDEGNVAYRNGSYQNALVNYNKAMAYAPNGSLSLKLAYSNRSAVLFTAKEYKACIEDCNTALAMDCVTPNAITEKLRKRISQAKVEQNERFTLGDNVSFKKYADKFFKLTSHNNEVPCVTKDVDIVIASGMPKVIAKRDIAAGTLVGLEKAFVTWAPNDFEQYHSCHYCRKLDFNLFPCDGCVFAMFCSKKCKESCMAEYHTTECKIAGFFIGMPFSQRWVVKAILKIINMCGSWDKLISLSHDYGYDKIKKSTVNEIYDGENPSSVLCFTKERHFLHGVLFNSAIQQGLFLHLLQNLQSFLPEDWKEKLLAIRAMAKIMMYLHIYTEQTLLGLVINVSTLESMELHSFAHMGLFPFTGKLKHSCIPNLQILPMNNSIGLVAVENIKAGSELTVSHVFHWLDNFMTVTERSAHMFINIHRICTCIVCTTSPEELTKKTELTIAQKKAIKECYTLENCRLFGIPIEKCFERIYNALICLNDIKFSADYAKVYKMLKQMQMYTVDKKMNNNVLCRVSRKKE